jgi:type IV pilus assembly protein PilW
MNMRTESLHSSCVNVRNAGAQRGVTLIELMVALTVSLVLVLAAVVLYASTTTSQRTLDEISAANEGGAFALRAIGRDLANAGFYPAVRLEDPSIPSATSRYASVVGLPTAYASGLFGCEGAAFNVTTRTCGTTVAGAPDSLVVGYFSNDAFGVNVGQRADCEGNDIAAAAFNNARRGTPPAGQPPTLPVFGANHYRLTNQQTTTLNGRAVTTRSLACAGNGDGNNTYTALVPGIVDMQLSYGVFSDDSLLPTQFYTASQVGGLPTITFGGQQFRPWEQVIAVRVCVIARTFQSAVALSSGAVPPTYVGCDGAINTNAAGDSSIRKTYIQTFGVRNRQGSTY